MPKVIETEATATMSQRSFASAEFALKKKRTRREKFLAEMERVVPWARLIAVIEPLYPTSGRVGRQPMGVPKMLRMYLLQQWYGLADEALEDAIYDSRLWRLNSANCVRVQFAVDLRSAEAFIYLRFLNCGVAIVLPVLAEPLVHPSPAPAEVLWTDLARCHRRECPEAGGTRQPCPREELLRWLPPPSPVPQNQIIDFYKSGAASARPPPYSTLLQVPAGAEPHTRRADRRADTLQNSSKALTQSTSKWWISLFAMNNSNLSPWAWHNQLRQPATIPVKRYGGTREDTDLVS